MVWTYGRKHTWHAREDMFVLFNFLDLIKDIIKNSNKLKVKNVRKYRETCNFFVIKFSSSEFLYSFISFSHIALLLPFPPPISLPFSSLFPLPLSTTLSLFSVPLNILFFPTSTSPLFPSLTNPLMVCPISVNYRKI